VSLTSSVRSFQVGDDGFSLLRDSAALCWFASAISAMLVHHGLYSDLAPRHRRALDISTWSNAAAALLTGVLALLFAFQH
jgi:hypothetical protein